MNINEIFDEVAKQMRSDIEKARKATTHPGLKGLSFEETFRIFLREYLPKTLDISTGILVDANGNSSRQIDIIISDAVKTPIFYKSGEIRVIPIECAYAAIEIKANLDSNEIDRIFQNMKSVRYLEKKSYIKPAGVISYTYNLYGKEWDILPINYFVFAFDSIDLMSLATTIYQKHKTEHLPEWSRIDTVCVLDKGVICNQLKNGLFSATPEPNSQSLVCYTNRSLLLFYSLISPLLNQAKLPDFRFTDYLAPFSTDRILVLDT